MKYVRLKRRDPKHGIVLKQYVFRGIRFLESGGWYVVDDEVAAYLETVRQRSADSSSLAAFDICTEAAARKIDEQESIEATPRRPADNARATKARGLTSEAFGPAKKKRGRKRSTQTKKTDKTDTTAETTDAQTETEKGE